MNSPLDKVMLAAGYDPRAWDPVPVGLAADPDKDGDDDSDHTSHSLFKNLRKRNMPAKSAAAICAKADAKND